MVIASKRRRWLSPTPETVQQNLVAIPDARRRNNLVRIYNGLIRLEGSAYSEMLTLCEQCIANGQALKCSDIFQISGIECAPWPHLYPFRNWCDTSFTGHQHRKSAKLSFFVKLLSEIIDYSLSFELLQFHYDRWVYKTVTGAIHTARKENCSPYRSLDSKTFSMGFWKRQHSFLLDALRQFGKPSLFFTFLPYECSFPFPKWLDVRDRIGHPPIRLAGAETYSVAHALEQIVRGYLTGCNDQRWRSHVFSYSQIPTQNNVLTYFYRFEFQKRGTIHMHLLVWLRDISEIDFKGIRADVPTGNPEAAFSIREFQKSDKPMASYRIYAIDLN